MLLRDRQATIGHSYSELLCYTLIFITSNLFSVLILKELSKADRITAARM